MSAAHRLAAVKMAMTPQTCRGALRLFLAWTAALGFWTSAAAAAGFDHRLSFDDSGIWARHNQQALQYTTIAVELGGALWLGSEDPLGRTFWQTIDASIFSSVTAQGAKYIFGRARPSQTDDPNQWFKGSCCHSFPSGEVALQASFVTPFIANYAAAHPWVWALEIIPLYDGVARRPRAIGRPTSSRAGPSEARSGTTRRHASNRCSLSFFRRG